MRTATVGGASTHVSTEETIALPAPLAAQDIAIGSAAAPLGDRERGLALTTTDGGLFVAARPSGRFRAIAGEFDHDPTLLCWLN